MRHYEVMVILDPDLEERAVSPPIEHFLSLVREGGGKVEKVDTWGRRRLAYEIKKKPEGIYSVVDLRPSPARQGARPPAEPERVGPPDQGPPPRDPLTFGPDHPIGGREP